MWSDYYLAIISQIEHVIQEFSICTAIILWYIGTMIGSFLAIQLHTSNRTKSILLLVSWSNARCTTAEHKQYRVFLYFFSAIYFRSIEN